MALLTGIAAEKDDNAFLDSIDPRKGGDGIKNFSYVLGMEAQNHINRVTAIGNDSGHDAVMGRLEDLRYDAATPADVKKRAEEIWDMVLDAVIDIEKQNKAILAAAPPALPAGMTTDPFPEAQRRYDAQSERYAEQNHRRTHGLQSDDLPEHAQTGKDLQLFADMRAALKDDSKPLHALANHHAKALEVMDTDMSLRSGDIADQHKKDQISGAEKGASDELNNARKGFVARYKKDRNMTDDPAPGDFDRRSYAAGESSVISSEEAGILRQAAQIKTSAALRIEEQRAKLASTPSQKT